MPAKPPALAVLAFSRESTASFSQEFGGGCLMVIDEKLGVKRSILRHVVRLQEMLENSRSQAVREHILEQIADLRREASMINGR